MQRIGNCSKRFSNLLFRSFHSSPKFLEIEKKDISSSSSSSFSSSSSSSSSSSLPKVFVLFGATGTGKTTLAVGFLFFFFYYFLYFSFYFIFFFKFFFLFFFYFFYFSFLFCLGQGYFCC